MTTQNIAIVSVVGVAAVAMIGTGTALMIRRRNRLAAQTDAMVTETETAEESVAAGAEAFLAEQDAAVLVS